MKHNTTQAGFTMIEVLVSVSIIAALTTLMWASIDSTFETRDFMTKQFEQYQTARIAMDRFKDELASAFLAGPKHGGRPLPKEQFQTEKQKKRRQQNPDREPIEYGMIGEDDEIHFTTFGHRRSRGAEGTSYQAEVSYYIEKQRKDGDLVSTLMRREDTTLDGELDEGGTAFVMIPEIEEIKFEYWDPGPVKVGTRKEMAQEGQWVDSWNTDQSEFSGRLPTRIRITLVLPPASSMGSKLRFTTQTQVGAFEVLEF